MKEVTLHVGLHKTATKSFQETCSINREKLEKQGFYYPIFHLDHRLINNHSIPFYSLFSNQPEQYHVNIGWAVDANEVNKKYEEQLNHILKQQHEKIIISGEDISRLSQLELEKMRKKIESYGYSVRVLATVRPLHSMMNSHIQEIIKNGWTISYANCKNLGILVINSIKVLESVFPKTEFFSFQDLLKHQHGPVGFLLEKIGVANVADLKIVRANESISAQATRLISYINQEQPLILNGKLNPFRKDDDINPIYQLKGDKFQLSKQELKPYEEELSQANQYLSTKFNPSFCDQPSSNLSDQIETNWDDKKINQLKMIIAEVNNNIKLIAYDYCKNVICLDEDKLSYIFFDELSVTLGIPIYRFRNSEIPGIYLLVMEEEAHDIRTNYPNFIEEGITFYGASSPSKNLIPLYRFQNNQHPGLYIYIGESERNYINNNPSFAENYQDEGIAFYVYAPGIGIGKPFYRFRNSNIPEAYIYVTGTEADYIRENLTQFIELGIAFESVT